MKLSIQYWRRHARRAALLLSTIMLGVMAMTAVALFARSATRWDVESSWTFAGDYDVYVPEADAEDWDVINNSELITRKASILNGGTCKTAFSEAYFFGSMDADAQEMFHYAPDPGGRYPERAGEACGYRSVFQKMGIVPAVGTRFSMDLFDAEGNRLGSKAFTITGILNDGRFNACPARSMEATGGGGGEIDFPQIFVSEEDIPQSHTVTALLRCREDQADHDVANALKREGVLAVASDRVIWFYNLSGQMAETEAEMTRLLRYSYGDFFSSFVVPVFFAIILFVSFVSIYGIFSEVMADRQRQMGVLRSIGLSRKGMIARLCAEGLFFAALGVALGIALGIAVYGICRLAINQVPGVYIYSAFGADATTRAISVNPFVLPCALGLAICAAAIAIPMIRASRLMPREMMLMQKRGVARRAAAGGGGTGRIAQRVVRLGTGGGLGARALVFVTGWVFVFGAAFMAGKADYENSKLSDGDDSAKADYAVHRDMASHMCGNVQFNRHGDGVSMEDLDAVMQSGDVAAADAVIQLPGVKVYYPEDAPRGEADKALEPLDLDHNIDSTREELFRKSKEALGYAEGDRIYQVPCAAVGEEQLEALSPYVESGELDVGGLSDGSKVAIIEYEGAEMENPFSVGDHLDLTDVVIKNQEEEDFDFSTGEIPPGSKPQFDFTDANGTKGPGYVYGEKALFGAEVCAVLRVSDAGLQARLYHESYIMKEERGEDESPYVSPGYQILCGFGAPKSWGLPDGLITDLYVDLADGASQERFESLWYPIVGRSGDVENECNADVRLKERANNLRFLSLFAFMAALTFLIGAIGMANAYQFSISRNARSLQTMRAAGMSRAAMLKSHVREVVVWPLFSVATSVIPLAAFDVVRRYAYHYAFDLGHSRGILLEDGRWITNWQTLFPWGVEVWSQPVFWFMLAGFALLALFGIGAVILPLRRMDRESIADGLRGEDF